VKLFNTKVMDIVKLSQFYREFDQFVTEQRI